MPGYLAQLRAVKPKPAAQPQRVRKAIAPDADARLGEALVSIEAAREKAQSITRRLPDLAQAANNVLDDAREILREARASGDGEQFADRLAWLPGFLDRVRLNAERHVRGGVTLS